MKIFTSQQIREADKYTIENEPVSGLALMERAAKACVNWLQKNYTIQTPFHIFCGTGNNGGDGLAIGRILKNSGWQAVMYNVMFSEHSAEENLENKKKIKEVFNSAVIDIRSIEDFPELPEDAVIIDAIFGTGLTRPLEGMVRGVVDKINESGKKVISIDVPSGLQAEKNEVREGIVRASDTLSLEFYKLASLFSENAQFTGNVHLLHIGIHPDYIKNTETPYHLSTKVLMRRHLFERNRFSHKGTYGHALILAGSYGKAGAAVLATKAALRSGVGLVSSFVPKSSYDIVQTASPEAMCITGDGMDFLADFNQDLTKYSSLGIGPGIGTAPETVGFLEDVLKQAKAPLVMDADALNILSKHPELFKHIPEDSILTPHPREFERLFGKTSSSFDRLQLQMKKSAEHKVNILLKGHNTSISSPEGTVWFNSTGNSGMSSGGSGDVLTGLLTGFLAQGYAPNTAAILGGYLHGLSGDLSLEDESISMESMTATTLINHLGKAFKAIKV